MVHGRPDWVRTTTLQDIRDVFGNIPQVSMGELAARLGSIDIFDRRGEVVFLDNFDSPTLKWEKDFPDSVGEIIRTNESALHGDYSIKMTTGPESAHQVRMRKYHYLPVRKRIGVEYSFALGAGYCTIFSSFVLYTTTAKYDPRVWYKDITSELFLYDRDLGSVLFPEKVNLREDDFTYNTWKLVVDLDTEKYVRLLLNDIEYDLSAYSLPKSENSYSPYMYLSIYVINTAAGAHYAYIDSVIFTQNEP